MIINVAYHIYTYYTSNITGTCIYINDDDDYYYHRSSMSNNNNDAEESIMNSVFIIVFWYGFGVCFCLTRCYILLFFLRK